jgi:hypothetical protein
MIEMETNSKNNLDYQVDMDCVFEDEINNLKMKEKEAERYLYVCKKKIKEYEEKLKKAEERIHALREYTKNIIYSQLNVSIEKNLVDKNSIKETKTQLTYIIPSAKFIFKKEKEKIIKKNEGALIEYLYKNQLTDFIKVEKNSKWGEFKKQLKISNGNIINEDGEIVSIDGVSIETEPASFEIKYI